MPEEQSSYALITQQLVAYGMAEGLTEEHDLLDLIGARRVKMSGEELYYREYEEFERQTKESDLSPPQDYTISGEERFNEFWHFMQATRTDLFVRYRPALTREQALNFLPIDTELMSQQEIRSQWMQEVFAVILKYLPTYRGTANDYQALLDIPEAMFQLNFIDAAYQRLIDSSLDQMQFNPPTARLSFVPRETKPAPIPAEISISENPEVELIATLSR